MDEMLQEVYPFINLYIFVIIGTSKLKSQLESFPIIFFLSKLLIHVLLFVENGGTWWPREPQRSDIAAFMVFEKLSLYMMLQLAL